MVAAPYAQQYNVTQDENFLNRLSQAIVAGAVTQAAGTFSAAPSGTSLPAYQMQQALAASILTGGVTAKLLGLFAAAVTCNATVAADLSNAVPVLIASSTAVMPSAITTAAVHGLSTGNTAEISGHAVNTAVNGIWKVTVTSTTVFTVPVPGNAVGAATGQVTLQPPDADLDTAIAAVWADIAGATVEI
jgi:hypothetical protein